MRSTNILKTHNRPGIPQILLALVLGLAALSGPRVLAQPSSPPPAPPESAAQKPPPLNRWLLVVDISSAMERRSEGIADTIGLLLGSAMGGQLQPGDTVGLWTFTDTLQTGQFPLQEWTPPLREHVAQRAIIFLRDQKYEKKSRLETALDGIRQVIRTSDYLTVVLISDGRQPISGTPFDEQINENYRSWKDWKKSPLPIVTLLRSKHGRITDFSVAVPPWPIEFPPLPPELLASRVRPALTTAPSPAPKPAPPPPVGPSIIVSGKNPTGLDTEITPALPVAAPVTSNIVATPVASNVIPEPVVSNAIAAPAASNAIAAPAVSNTVAASVTSNAVTAPVTPTPAEVSVATTPDAAKPPVEQSKTVPEPAPVVASKPVEEPKAEPVTQAPVAQAPVAQPSPTESSAVQPPASEPSRPTAPAATGPMTVVARESAPTPAAVQSKPPVQTGTVPTESFLRNNVVWFVGLGFCGATFGVFMLMRRSRQATGPISLITRSLDRE